MGCGHSKKKNKNRKSEKKDFIQQDERGNGVCAPPDVLLEKQVERFEWQLRILKEVLSANGNSERAELLKGHADEEVCALVLSIFDKVKTETTADLNVLHEHKSQTASDTHQQQLDALQTQHQQEKEALTRTFAVSENMLKEEVKELRDELQTFNELKRRVAESNFNRDLQRNIQEQGSPGSFWHSECESLLFVIEMKSEQVQQHNNKLQHMELLVQRNLSLEDQTVHVLQQNEDLKVRIENSHTLIQQLSKEQQDLKVALERQLVLNQKLCQEKEELVFKLRHRDSSPALLLPAMVPELAPR